MIHTCSIMPVQVTTTKPTRTKTSISKSVVACSGTSTTNDFNTHVASRCFRVSKNTTTTGSASSSTMTMITTNKGMSELYGTKKKKKKTNIHQQQFVEKINKKSQQRFSSSILLVKSKIGRYQLLVLLLIVQLVVVLLVSPCCYFNAMNNVGFGIVFVVTAQQPTRSTPYSVRQQQQKQEQVDEEIVKQQNQHQQQQDYYVRHPQRQKNQMNNQQQQKQKPNSNSPTVRLMTKIRRSTTTSSNNKNNDRKRPKSSSQSSFTMNNNTNSKNNYNDIFHSVFITTKNRKPRNIVEGIILGLKVSIQGMIMGLFSIVSVPILWYQKTKTISGILYGTMTGTIYAIILILSGYYYGLQKLLQGIIVTPTYIQSYKNGVQWNATTQHYDYYSIDTELNDILYYTTQVDDDTYNNDNTSKGTTTGTSSRTNNNNRRGGTIAAVADTTYYNILNVPTSAKQTDIKQSYYRIAKDIHPDKNPNDTAAAERFRILYVAYTTLYDPIKRSRYDKFGLQSSTSSIDDEGNSNNGNIPSILLNFNPNIFFATVFNTQLIEPYIGELQISTFTDDIIYMAYKRNKQQQQRYTSDLFDTNENNNNEQQQKQNDILNTFFSNSQTNNNGKQYPNNGQFVNNNNSNNNKDLLDNYKQEKRQLDIAVYLRTKIHLYITGQIDRSTFTTICHTDAMNIRTGSYYGPQFLYIIGTSLLTHGEQYYNSYFYTTSTISSQEKENHIVHGVVVDAIQKLKSTVIGTSSRIIQTSKTFTTKTKRSMHRLSQAVHKFISIVRIIVNAAQQEEELELMKNNNSTTGNNYYTNKKRQQQQQQQQQQKLMEENIRKVLPPLMDMAWAYISYDIEKTIHGSCRKLFMDTTTTSTIPNTTPNSSNNNKNNHNASIKLLRAEAIMIMGTEFLSVSSVVSSSLLFEDSTNNNHNTDLMKRLEVAYRLATMSSVR